MGIIYGFLYFPCLLLFFLDPTVSFILSHFRHVISLVLSSRGITVSLFQHMVLSILPCHHISYIISLLIQDILLLDQRYPPFIPLEELIFWLFYFYFNHIIIRFQVWYRFNHNFITGDNSVPPYFIFCSCFLPLTLVLSWFFKAILIFDPF